MALFHSRSFRRGCLLGTRILLWRWLLGAVASSSPPGGDGGLRTLSPTRQHTRTAEADWRCLCIRENVCQGGPHPALDLGSG